MHAYAAGSSGLSRGSCSSVFSDGRSLEQLTKDLESGKTSIADVPTIRVVKSCGSFRALDNRRFLCMQTAFAKDKRKKINVEVRDRIVPTHTVTTVAEARLFCIRNICCSGIKKSLVGYFTGCSEHYFSSFTLPQVLTIYELPVPSEPTPLLGIRCESAGHKLFHTAVSAAHELYDVNGRIA